jgi:hypothetical protein
MDDATTVDWQDWREYVGDAGYFKLEVEADALDADGLTVTAPALVQLSASPDAEEEGIDLEITVQPPAAFFDSVWFDPDHATVFADAVREVLAADGEFSKQVVAYPSLDAPERREVVVEIATNPVEFDGIYLDMSDRVHATRTAVLTSREFALALADAADAAVVYVADHGHQ